MKCLGEVESVAVERRMDLIIPRISWFLPVLMSSLEDH